MPRQTQAGNLNVDLRMDDRQFTGALRRASARLDSFGQRVSSIAAGNIIANLTNQVAGLGQRLVSATVEASGFGATLVEQAAVTGLSANRLDLLRRAFEANGASVASTDAALAKFNRRLDFAARGQEEYARVFRQLNLDPAGYDNTEEALRDVIQAISELPTASERGAAAFRLFGTSAQAFQKTINDGLPALDREIARQRELGQITDSQAANLKDLNQAFTDATNIVNLQFRAALGDLVGGLGDLNAHLETAFTWLGRVKDALLLVSGIRAVQFYARQVAGLADWQRGLMGLNTTLVETTEPALSRHQQQLDDARVAYAAWRREAEETREVLEQPLAPVTPVATADLSNIFADDDNRQRAARERFARTQTRLIEEDREQRRQAAEEREQRARAIASLELRLAESVRQENIKYAEQLEAAWDNVGSTVSGLITSTRSWADLLRNVVGLAAEFASYLAGGGQGGLRGFLGFPSFRQYGGPVQSGRPYVVGERGPELFVPSSAGHIERNANAAPPAQTINVYVDGNPDANSLVATLDNYFRTEWRADFNNMQRG